MNFEFFVPYCRICFKLADCRYFCEVCAAAIGRLRRQTCLDWLMNSGGQGGGYRRMALFHYEGVMRRLILRVKVKGDYAALRVITHLVKTAPEVLELVSWADVIMPAPSSLWGRLRGRIDTSDAIAYSLSRRWGRKQVCSAPWQLYWRTRKRAKIKRNLRTADTQIGFLGRFFSRYWERRYWRSVTGRKILVIDDISTTGVTLLETAEALAAVKPDEIRMLVVAMPRS